MLIIVKLILHDLLITSMAINKCIYRSMSLNICHHRNFLTWSIRYFSISNVFYDDINHNLLHSKVVLSTKNRQDCVERCKKLSAISSKDYKNTKNAAVLVPLCLHDNELGFLYTLRSKSLSTDGGHVSFPGGVKDDTDDDLQATALRESWEELRIPKEKVDVWTQGNFIGRKDVIVMPVLGYVGEINPEELKVNHDEVEEAFFISLKHFCDLKYCRYTQFRAGYTLPSYTGGKHRIWGLTGLITHVMLRALIPDVYKHKFRLLNPIGQLTKDKKK